MKRVVVLLALFALVLAGCGGGSGEVVVPEPPSVSAYEKGSNEKIDTVVADWQAQVPATLVSQGVQQATIQEKTYQSSATLQEVADFYSKTLPENGWVEVRNMPGLQNGFYTTGYDNGTNHLAIGAIDARQFGGQGVVIYTAKGTK